MVRNFIFNDIILYAKGWYERSEDICDDLGYLIDEIYGWCPIEESEVAMYMLNVLDTLYEELAKDGQELSIGTRWYNSHRLFESEVRHRMDLYGCTRDRAIISIVLCVLQDLTRDEIELRKPVYGKKCHFRMGQLIGGKFPISMTYTTMNKVASKMFDNKPKKYGREKV